MRSWALYNLLECLACTRVGRSKQEERRQYVVVNFPTYGAIICYLLSANICFLRLVFSRESEHSFMVELDRRAERDVSRNNLKVVRACGARKVREPCAQSERCYERYSGLPIESAALVLPRNQIIRANIYTSNCIRRKHKETRDCRN